MARTREHPRPRKVSPFNHAPPSDLSRLPHLPEEIMQMILKNLMPIPQEMNFWKNAVYDMMREKNTNKKTLAAVARSSKRMNRLATPVLYRNIDLEYHDPKPHKTWTSVLTHIVNHRATKVERLFINSFRAEEKQTATMDNLDTCRTRLSELDLTDIQVDRIIMGLQSGSVDATYATALLLCPSITELSIVFLGIDWEETIVHELLTRKVDEPGYNLVLSGLQHAYCEHWDTENSTSCWLLRPILSRPSLLSLHGNIISICDFDFNRNETREVIPLEPIYARHLCFEDSTMDNPGLQALLEASKQLDSFSYTHGQSNISGDDVEMDFPVTGAILREHGTSLKKLKLDFEDASCWSAYGDPGDVLPFGSLKELDSLIELDVDMNALLGTQRHTSTMLRTDLRAVLPDSIEVLVLRCTEVWEKQEVLAAELDKQLLLAMQSFEHLKLIRLHHRKSFDQILSPGWSVSITADYWEVINFVDLKRE